MRGRKNRALQVPPVAPYKALENFCKALYGTSAQFFRPLMVMVSHMVMTSFSLALLLAAILKREKGRERTRAGHTTVMYGNILFLRPIFQHAVEKYYSEGDAITILHSCLGPEPAKLIE